MSDRGSSGDEGVATGGWVTWMVPFEWSKLPSSVTAARSFSCRCFSVNMDDTKSCKAVGLSDCSLALGGVRMRLRGALGRTKSMSPCCRRGLCEDVSVGTDLDERASTGCEPGDANCRGCGCCCGSEGVGTIVPVTGVSKGKTSDDNGLDEISF